jgi:hypothetical protein
MSDGLNDISQPSFLALQWQHFVVLAVGIVIGFVVARCSSDKPSKQEPKSERVDDRTFLEDDSTQQLEGVFIPSTGIIRSNKDRAHTFENDLSYGSCIPLHRPTDDPTFEKSGDYPYHYHFKGRKRLWEVRVQFRFKKAPGGPLKFGIELDNFVKLSNLERTSMSATVAALRRIVGEELYHSPGDDPMEVIGEEERPVFIMPLWAMDQVIVTPKAERPPDLTDPTIPEQGMRRNNDRRAFIKYVESLELVVGPTYTFCFWGISQMLDVIQWQVRGVIPGVTVNFNKFCGQPPVHLVLYTLDDSEDESRHLQSRKNYYFHCAFWSSMNRPCKERLSQLVPDPEALRVSSSQPVRQSWSAKLFGPCYPSSCFKGAKSHRE